MAHRNKYKKLVVILALVVVIEAIAIFALLFSRPKKKIMKVKRRPAPAAQIGKIAIVIDDWGYNQNNLALLKQIKQRVTLAILPNLPYSVKISQEARALGQEVILHFPMEPQEKSHLEQNTIMTGMDEPTIRQILALDLDSVNSARGISNHMGSAAVSDMRTMTVIFAELKRRGLYFLDSYVTSGNVAAGLAGTMEVGYARRNVFLDNKEDAEYIKNQVNQLKKKARLYGKAIGIGHDRRLTLQVLKELMPQMEKEGYRFVFVSELIK
ncbi:MAG: divergent polysaccharide deacetylase family protein [Candidatus Omnitrophota bacterium]